MNDPTEGGISVWIVMPIVWLILFAGAAIFGTSFLGFLALLFGVTPIVIIIMILIGTIGG